MQLIIKYYFEYFNNYTNFLYLLIQPALYTSKNSIAARTVFAIQITKQVFKNIRTKVNYLLIANFWLSVYQFS